jgi:hypothetical protein
MPETIDRSRMYVTMSHVDDAGYAQMTVADALAEIEQSMDAGVGPDEYVWHVNDSGDYDHEDTLSDPVTALVIQSTLTEGVRYTTDVYSPGMTLSELLWELTRAKQVGAINYTTIRSGLVLASGSVSASAPISKLAFGPRPE